MFRPLQRRGSHAFELGADSFPSQTPFRPEDWSRLKKIADGNPDESKIGAFGVGYVRLVEHESGRRRVWADRFLFFFVLVVPRFYSLFSVTEEPLVESGGTWMGFHWKGGGDQVRSTSCVCSPVPHRVELTSPPCSRSSLSQLFARTGALPQSTTPPPQSHFGLPLTSFTMNLRTPSPLPASPLELARFLATSITFMQSLERAELFFDDARLVLVEKEMGTMKRLEVPKGIDRGSVGGLMRVEGLESTGS